MTKIPDIVLPEGEVPAQTTAQVPYSSPESVAQSKAAIARYKAITALANAIAETVPNSAGNLQLIQAYSNAIGELK